MRIAYVTTYDSNDPHAWSGLGWRIRQSLERAGADVTPIGPLQHKYGSWFRVKGAIHRRYSRRLYESDREPLLLRHYAGQVSAALARATYDVVFSPGTIPIAHLQTDTPVVFWTDATFPAMLGYYPAFTNLAPSSERNGRRMEASALARCRLALYSSEWAATSAVKLCGADAARVKVVPFGANLDVTRCASEVAQLVARRRLDPVRLLFVGAEWERKRGDLAIDVVNTLNERGIRAHLHVVGARPPRGASPYVSVHGFISKATADGRAELDALFGASTFLILPSSAECCAVVLAEASSFGLPSLATRVGGNATAVRDGVNGQTFSVEDGAAAYCDVIQRTVSSRQKYVALATSSFREYQDRLNWDTAGETALSLMRSHCMA